MNWLSQEPSLGLKLDSDFFFKDVEGVVKRVWQQLHHGLPPGDEVRKQLTPGTALHDQMAVARVADAAPG